MSIHQYPDLLALFVVYADFESILQRVNEDEAMDITQGVAVDVNEPTPAAGLCIQAGEQCGTGLIQTSCLLQSRGSWVDVFAEAARGSGAGVSGVHFYFLTTASAHRGRIAFLPHCHQLSHMQPVAGRGQSA